MDIRYEIKGLEQFKKEIVAGNKELVGDIVKAINTSTQEVRKQIILTAPSGPTRKGGDVRRSGKRSAGKLRQSITAPPVRALVGLVKIGTSVPYARIQEFGGTITARTAKYLRFQTYDGAWHRVKSVILKPKLYVTKGFDNALPKVEKIFSDVVEKWIRRLGK